MTSVTRTVKRLTAATVRDRTLRQIVVIIEPPGRVLGFRAKGSRRVYNLPIEWCYTQAVLAYATAQRKAKREAKQQRKGQ